MIKEKVYQTNFTNTLLKFDTNESHFNEDEQRYEVVDERHELFVYFEIPDNYEGKYTLDDFQFTKTTQRLLVFLIQKFTNLSPSERTEGLVEFTTKEFQNLCELKDRDNTKRMIERDLFSLFCIRCVFDGREFYIIEDIGVGRGRFAAILHVSVADDLSRHKSYILLPQFYYSIPLHKSPQAPGWVYYLVYQEYVNNGRPSKGRISINSLLLRTDYMTIDEIRQTKNNSVKERVITPLFRNLFMMTEIFEFRFFDKKGNELKAVKVQQLTYEELIKIVIHYELRD